MKKINPVRETFEVSGDWSSKNDPKEVSPLRR